MKKLSILLSIHFFILLTGCASTCMEYRSATTAARSEKDLKRAEEWGLKAMVSPECNPATNAHAPYFLATEVYLQQKKYTEMATMLDLAEKRNPDQPLEIPFKLGDTPIETTIEGVEAFRDQEWTKVYNKAVDYIQKDKIDRAKKQIETAILIHPQKEENYLTLAAIHMQNNDLDAALTTANRGLDANDESSVLYELKADILLQTNPDISKMESANELYQIAIKYSDNSGPIKIKLLNIFIELGHNEKAIDFADNLLNQYPNDPNIYYNVGVVYLRMAKEIQDRSKIKYNELNNIERPTENIIRELYSDFKQLRKYASFSKDYFYEALDLEQKEKLDTKNAIAEMKLAINQMDNIFIPSIRETARLASIELE